MLRSTPFWFVALCAAYLAIIGLALTAASYNEICGEGEDRVSCEEWAFVVALNSALAICVATSLVVVVRIVWRRRVAPLLKGGAILFAGSLLSIILPLLAAGNKIHGAVMLLGVFPLSFALLFGAMICIVLWASRAGSSWGNRLAAAGSVDSRC